MRLIFLMKGCVNKSNKSIDCFCFFAGNLLETEGWNKRNKEASEASCHSDVNHEGNKAIEPEKMAGKRSAAKRPRSKSPTFKHQKPLSGELRSQV